MAKKRSYEELYADLEATITELEDGELPLEDAVKLYERGIALAGQCQQLLDSAELRIQQLMDGSLSPFDPAS